jgi:hypothetical protein
MNMVAVGILLRLSKGEESKRGVDKTEALIERKKALLSVYGRRHSLSRYGRMDGQGNP